MEKSEKSRWANSSRMKNECGIIINSRIAYRMSYDILFIVLEQNTSNAFVTDGSQHDPIKTLKPLAIMFYICYR